MEKGKKKGGKARKQMGVVLGLLFGGLGGAVIGYWAVSSGRGEVSGGSLVSRLLLMAGTLAGVYVQVIIHEAGHLIFGLLTGYKFLSFRIASFMWVKERGKVRFRRLSLVGTGGQCLMVPPAMVEGKMPFVLYNLGGALLNIAAGVLFLGLAALCGDAANVATWLRMTGAFGFLLALMNGIPMRLGAVDNDGYNAVALGKNAEALRSFWIQLSTSGEAAKGARLKDLPGEWFALPPDEAMKNSMVAALGVFHCNWLMDAHSFEEAHRCMDRLLAMDSAMIGLHRSLLNCDRIYCELMGEGRKERLDDMLDAAQKKFMRAMKKFPSVLRTEYAYALLAEEDLAKAAKIKAAFDKVAHTYPYQSDIESERELMKMAEDVRGR